MPDPLTIQAAEGQPPRVSGTAYNGGKLRQYYWDDPLVVDLAGMEVGSEEIPLLADHYNSATNRLGLVKATVAGGRLDVEGTIVSETERAQEIVAQGTAGADWQLSIGATIRAVEHVKEGSRTINGQNHQAPFYNVTQSTLNEVSVVAVGADQSTRLHIAASLVNSHPQGVLAMPGENKDNATKIEGAQPPAKPVKEPTTVTATEPAEDPARIAARAIEAERKRVADIRAICDGECADIEAKAIAEGQTPDQVRQAVLADIRARRPQGVFVNTGAGAPSGFPVLHAAALLAFGVAEKTIIADCGDKAIEAAHKQFRYGIGLQQMLVQAAAANGCQYGDFRNYHREILQAAFSSVSLPGILSNVANKRLLASFEAVESVWEQITAKRNVSDFKEVTGYRLTGDQTFEKVGPDGELKHGTLGEESYGNKAETYGKIMVLTRQMQINDDMGALETMFRRLGRGCALKVNSVFWTEFKDNATFFKTANGNYMSGAASALSIDGLTAGELLFLKMTDPEGNPMSIEPKILLTPVDLKVTARQLTVDTTIVIAGSTDKLVTNGNPHVGKQTPLSSAYLNDSTTAWYLLADPEDVPVIETVFLNGVQRPTVENADADFNTLGVQFRGYFDFGVRKQDYRGGIKSKGAA